MLLFRKPLLPSHYSIWFEPPDESGDEILRIVSARRSLKLKGHSFREFHKRVVPLLDGRHTMEEIERSAADVFAAADLREALDMLGRQGILVEGDGLDLPEDTAARLTPQLNYLHEMTEGGRSLQSRLAGGTVAVLGLGGAGAATALGLAAAGVGKLLLVDPAPLAPSDLYHAPFFGADDVGRARADALADRVRASAPHVVAQPFRDAAESEDDVRRSIAGAGFVVCCLGPGQLNLTLKLNKVCVEDQVPWITCSFDGGEVVVGPAFHPGVGACYMCYRMRAVACAGNPEEAFAFERYLDRRKADDSAVRESLVFATNLAASLLGVETLKELTGFAEPSLVGRLLTIDLHDLRVQRHAVLRKPWCPVCFERGDGS
jgi:adenylyltransferase/sulfurtransferase